MRVLVFMCLFSVVSFAYAMAPAPPEPIKQSFLRFSTDHITLCERLRDELRGRLSPAAIEREEKMFRALDRYISNIRDEDMYGFRRALKDSSTSDLPYWSARIVTDLVGFRRVIDQIVVETLTTGDLRSDEEFIELLRLFWESERYHAYRFGLEAAPARH